VVYDSVEHDLVLKESFSFNESGGNSEEVTPVPMPNTAVKLFCVNGSWGLPPARVERCRAYILFHSSSVVEQSAVNRSVVGSSPTCGAIILESCPSLAEGARLEIV
jgi:hypothetical protein